MGSIYNGWGLGRTQIGEYDNGSIYSGWGLGRSQIGSYDDGSIYSGWGLGREKVGEYENGSIYSGWGLGRTQIGSYENGSIYRGWGLGRTQIGEYDGSPAGAAAMLLLSFEGKGAATSHNESSSEGGFIGDLLGIVGAIILFMVKLIPYYFLYFQFAGIMGMTWVGWICVVLMFVIGAATIGTPSSFPLDLILPIGIVYSLIFISFIPYWIILIYRRIKKQFTWKQVAHWYWKWFLKGPFAYKDIIDLKKEFKKN